MSLTYEELSTLKFRLQNAAEPLKLRTVDSVCRD